MSCVLVLLTVILTDRLLSLYLSLDDSDQLYETSAKSLNLTVLPFEFALTMMFPTS